MKNWFRLDTAALIFPAIMNHKWSNCFRLSANLTEEIDVNILQQAVNDLQSRFPTFYVSLKKGVFWFYLQEIKQNINVQLDYAYPLTYMSSMELQNACLRVLYYKNRIAVEFFHSITDGNGGVVYLSTLLARYITLKYQKPISFEKHVLNYLDKPQTSELEDSFQHNFCSYSNSRRDTNSYQLHGTTINNEKFLLTGIVETDKLIALAHQYKVSVNSFLSAVLLDTIITLQKNDPYIKTERDVKISVPINLRKLYASNTLRNFVLSLSIGVNPRLGVYTLQELCLSFQNQINIYASKQYMRGCISANVLPQKNFFIKVAPRIIKNIILSLVYNATVEKKVSLCFSNIGQIVLPYELEQHVDRFEFIIGVQKYLPNNVALTSYKGKTYINFIRNIKESELERLFFSKLVELGLMVNIECNRR